MTRETTRLSSVFRVVVCGLIASLIGCSSGDLPLAPNGAGQDQPLDPNHAASPPGFDSAKPSGKVTFAFSPLGLAKRAGAEKSITKTRRIRARTGGTIAILNRSTLASFLVPRGSLEKDTKISMSVTGQGMGMYVEFGPDGTTFDPPARLIVTFPAEDVDPDAIVSYLISDDGSKEKVDQTVKVVGRLIVINAEIPHFTIWESDDGDPADPPEGDGP